MDNTPYNAGNRDANDGKGPANLQNAPATVREKYNAGFDDAQKRQQQNRY